jgi:hypothetical protein
MKNKHLFFLMLGLGLVSLTLTGCGQVAPTLAPTMVPSPTLQSQPTEAPTEPAAGFPTGKFVEPGNEEAGFEFKPDGTWRAFNSIYTIGRGTYSVKGDLYVEETNSENCGTSPMSFKYSFDGTNLKFELTEESMNDDCDGRKMSFDGKTYVLAK